MADKNLSRWWTVSGALLVVLPVLLFVFGTALGLGNGERGREEEMRRLIPVTVAYGWGLVMFVSLLVFGERVLEGEEAAPSEKTGWYVLQGEKKLKPSAAKDIGIFFGATAFFAAFSFLCVFLVLARGSGDERRDDEEKRLNFGWSFVVATTFLLWSIFCTSFCIVFRYHLKDSESEPDPAAVSTIEGEAS